MNCDTLFYSLILNIVIINVIELHTDQSNYCETIVSKYHTFYFFSFLGYKRERESNLYTVITMQR
jgi:hypothetical protein